MDNNTVLTDFSMLEYPFIHEGMTYGEYEEEREYFIRHHDEYVKGTYQPLWKQRENI